MQDNKYSLPLEKQHETSSDYLNELQQENQRLVLENAQLKKSLEKEEFLHRNLYQQWTELNARTLVKDRELKKLQLRHKSWPEFYKYVFYALLLVTVLFTYYLLSKWGKNSASLQTSTTTKDTLNRATLPVQQQPGLPAKNIELQKKDTIAVPPQQARVINEPSEIQTQKISPNKSSTRYRVKAKAFFHNKPDESTRRKTFLLPYKDSYGIVTALDDKNDFIYIIYINHAGYTSKGWIRKIYLEAVD